MAQAVNATALKILMTLSKKRIPACSIKSRFAEIVNAGYLMQPSTGFLGVNYSTQNKHPLSGTNDLFTSRTVMSSLLVDNLKLLNDRRMFYYAEPPGTR